MVAISVDRASVVCVTNLRPSRSLQYRAGNKVPSFSRLRIALQPSWQRIQPRFPVIALVNSDRGQMGSVPAAAKTMRHWTQRLQVTDRALHLPSVDRRDFT